MRIVFGAMAAPLWQQLKMPRKKLEHCQAYADGIVRLLIGGILTDTEAHRARQRLMKKLEREAR